MTALPEILPGLDHETLTPIVRTGLGEPTAHLDGAWTCQPITGGAGHSLGVYRLSGQAGIDQRHVPWTLILKICPGDGASRPDQWLYGPREALAYRSGLLAALPAGVSAPRCYQVTDHSDGTVWLWLEDVPDDQPGPWSLDRHVWVAYLLGVSTASSLVMPPPRPAPWMDRRVLHTLVEGVAPIIAALDRFSAPDALPAVRAFFTPAIVARVRRLWDDRELLLEARDQLPFILCHRDAHRNNLRARRLADGSDLLVALDWEYVGLGVPGEELNAQLVGSFIFSDIGDVSLADFDAACFASFLAGMRSTGWDDDPRAIRLGHTTSVALRWALGMLVEVEGALSKPERYPDLEAMFGLPIEEIAAGWSGSVWPWCLDLAKEAHTLIAATSGLHS